MKKLPKNNKDNNEALEEHIFLANCLRMGLRIDDLKQLKYVDVAKLMLCFVDKNQTKTTKRATQKDWDKLAGRR